ncbi:rolling circle replication-associated protein [Holzapfeliella floricola]|uniref:rolling circle replication-associated protein n=1 Tax=Holzapfeliella floricola TaxID=679249 RepID=UPI000704CC68|nr:hypothetical protein [Holzapfeliella floricola]
MSYNKKIVQTNSYIEVYEYDKVIISENTKKINRRSKSKNFDELEQEEQLKRLHRISKTRQNAKWKVMRLIDTNFDSKTSFLTLTTKENIQNRDCFNKIFDKFIKRLNYKVFKTKKRLLKYLAVLEKQKRGAWHVHIILFDIPFIAHKELMKIWGLGGVWINKIDVDTKENRGRYVSKYFEKGIGQELVESYGKKSFYSSRNLKHPKEYKFISNETTENIIKHDELLYESEYLGKVYRKGKLVPNKIKYRKFKLNNSYGG